MSLEDFDYLLDFLKRSNSREVRLIGGEPTRHPLFHKFILKATFSPHIEHIHIFTNGTFSEEVLQMIFLQSYHKSISLLINYNNLPPKLDSIIKKNIEILRGKKNINITLGINVYKDNQDFDYFFDTQLKYDLRSIRFTIVTPYIKLKEQTQSVDMFDHFNSLLSAQKRFIYRQSELGLKVHPDCNTIPSCLWDYQFLVDMSIYNVDILENRNCEPVIDVLPDLKVIRCFMFSDYAVDIKQFSNVNEIRNYFINNIDRKLDGYQYKNSCKSCQFFRKYNHSCGCKQFHFSNMNFNLEMSNNLELNI